jgi:hypothetical protein
LAPAAFLVFFAVTPALLPLLGEPFFPLPLPFAVVSVERDFVPTLPALVVPGRMTRLLDRALPERVDDLAATRDVVATALRAAGEVRFGFVV